MHINVRSSLIRRLHLMMQNCMNTNVIILLQFVFVFNFVYYFVCQVGHCAQLEEAELSLTAAASH